MNILLTGGNGFLAKELRKYFSAGPKKIRVFSPGRDTLDVADPANVRLFFEQIDIDVVVHTAIKGGKRFHQDSIDDLFTNVAMYQNLLNFSHKFKIMFNFGSGAEFDRRYPIDVAVEEDIEERLPQDYYGMSKNLISRQILKKDKNIYNLLFWNRSVLCSSSVIFKTNFLRTIHFSNLKIGEDLDLWHKLFEKVFRACFVNEVCLTINRKSSNGSISRFIHGNESPKFLPVNRFNPGFANMINCRRNIYLLRAFPSFPLFSKFILCLANAPLVYTLAVILEIFRLSMLTYRRICALP